jgi:hypothetical protein
MEVTALNDEKERLPRGLYRCENCGAIRGVTRVRAYDGIHMVELKSVCFCEGLVCRKCGRRRIRRPITDYYDPADGRWIHVPYFAAQFGLCRKCYAASSRSTT